MNSGFRGNHWILMVGARRKSALDFPKSYDPGQG